MSNVVKYCSRASISVLSIQPKLQQVLVVAFFFVTETVCPARIPIDSRDEKGFDILLHLNLAKKTKKTQGTFYGTKAYQVTSRVDLSEATR